LQAYIKLHLFIGHFNHCDVIGPKIPNLLNNSHYAVQGHSRSPILVPADSPYLISYICINNSNLHHFWDMADYWSSFYFL